MKVTGTNTMDAPIEKVWEAFMNPEILVSTIPGCTRLDATAENQYIATVTMGVGAIKGSYQGKIELSDLTTHESLTLNAQAAGATGTITVEVKVRFTDLEGEKTRIDYEADATVGGMIGGVGQRMLTSVSKRMANEFFGNVDKTLRGERPLFGTATQAGAAVSEAATPGKTAPTGVAAVAGGEPASSRQDLFTGFLAGAITALLGVLVGAIAARRR